MREGIRLKKSIGDGFCMGHSLTLPTSMDVPKGQLTTRKVVLVQHSSNRCHHSWVLNSTNCRFREGTCIIPLEETIFDGFCRGRSTPTIHPLWVFFKGKSPGSFPHSLPISHQPNVLQASSKARSRSGPRAAATSSAWWTPPVTTSWEGRDYGTLGARLTLDFCAFISH